MITRILSFVGVVLVTSSVVHSTINPLLFKRVLGCFRPGMEVYAPNLGQVALKIGLVETIRMYGVQPGLETDGKRKWINDKAPDRDPVVALARVLFPSPTGQLTPETSSLKNIGRYLKVADIANLLNFCKRIRDIEQHAQNHRLFYKEETPQSQYWNKKNSEKKGNKLSNIFYHSKKKSIQDFLALFDRFSNDLYFQDFLENFTFDIKENEQFKKLIYFLFKIIEREERLDWYPQNLYPKYQSEQLLNAFFCLKFGADDIPELLENLDDSIVNKDALFQPYESCLSSSSDGEMVDNAQSTLITQDDVNEVLLKAQNGPSDLSLDDVWVLLSKDALLNITPYSDTKLPINNGLVDMYNRTDDELIDNHQFPDCVETTVRHLCNLALYSDKIQSFDLEKLRVHMQGSPYLKNIENFYALQTPHKANSGERSIRNAWNKVVAGVDDVRYCRKYNDAYLKNYNELDSGIINILSLVNTIFVLDLAPKPVYQDDVQFVQATSQWVKDSLQKLFHVLSPQKKCVINVANVEHFKRLESGQIDCSCIITITVDKSVEFVVDVMSSHAKFNSIKIVKKEEQFPNDLYQAIKEEIYDFNATVCESVCLLNKRLHDAISIPIYKLFNLPINDSAEIIKALENLCILLEQKLVLEKSVEMYLKNLLQSFLWSDVYMAKRIQPVIKQLKQLLRNQGRCQEIFKHEVKYINGEILDEDAAVLLTFFSGVESFSGLKKDSFIFRISELHEAIKKINLSGSEIQKIEGLENCPNLEELVVMTAKNLRHIELLSQMSLLKTIDLSGTQVEEIQGLENCPNLQNLNLNGINVKILKLPCGMNNLKQIDLSCSSVEEIIGLENCPSLENISLICSKNLKILKLSPQMNQLKSINLSWSVIEQIDGLDNCKNIENLDLYKTNNLKKIKLSGKMNQLKTIDVSLSGVEEIEIIGHMPELVEITGLDDLEKKLLFKGIEFCSVELQEKIMAHATIASLCI
jgi:hypothetical protein